MTNIALKLAKIRKDKEVSQQKMADLLGIPQRTWANYEKGRSNPSLKIIMKLTEMGYTFPELAGAIENVDDSMNQKEYKIDVDQYLIPMLDQKLSAGFGSYLPEDDGIKTYVPSPRYLSKYGEKLAALIVEGDSMEPTLRRGDMVVCDSHGWSREGIYAIQMDGYGCVKRLSKKPGKIVVLSDNPDYQPFEEPAESEAIRIIGHIHYVLKTVE